MDYLNIAKFITVPVALCVILPACSIVESDADRIVLRHSAENNLMIERTVNNHCESYGREAVLVQRSPVESKYLVQTVVSTYVCVDPPEKK